VSGAAPAHGVGPGPAPARVTTARVPPRVQGNAMEWPQVEPIKSTRIYEEIVRQVRLLIGEGRLKSGDRLPPERDLAEQFRVSRTSVREALRALESRGLVEIRAGEGAFVRDISVDALVEPLALVILPHREAVGELFEARRLLEPAIAALAARRATPEEIAEMERILDEQAREVAHGRTGVTQDSAFHAALAGGAHNRAISRIVNALMDLLTQSREESLQTPGRPQQSHQDHRGILEAIRQRDEVAAHRAVVDHLIAVERLVMGAHVDGAGPAASPRPPRRRGTAP
jgi:GntR family transcriptional repressor for pyruvate dehydrogenase complex